MSPLVLGEVLVVFVNWLFGDGSICSGLWELATPYSNAIIWKTKIFF